MQFEVLLKVELNDNDNDFKNIEEKIYNNALSAAQELTQLVIKNYDSTWLQTHKGYRNKGKEISKFVTSYGEIYVERHKVIYKDVCFHPVDHWMKVSSHTRTTERFNDLLSDTMTDTTYRKGNNLIKKMTGVERTTKSAWCLTQDIAKEKKKQNKIPVLLKDTPLKELKPGEENKCPILCIEVDATYCKPQPIRLTNHEVKIATLYTGKKYSGKKHKRAQLINKTTVTAKVGESLNSFFGKVAWIAHNTYGVNKDTIIIIKGDGDPWIIGLKYDYFPKALYFLDWWHVQKKMYLLFEDTEVAKMMKYIYARNPGELLDHLNLNYLSTGLDVDKFKNIESFYNYIEKNKEGLEPTGLDPVFKKKHPGMFKRGSGVIERNVDLFIGERCKIKRMSWSQKGLDNILYLRNYKINKEIKSPLIETIKKMA